MPLVLGAILLFVAVGLFAHRLGPRQHALCACIAVAVAVTYLLADGIS
jgi:hypothetical protein